MKEALLKAARADDIPEGESGLWSVRKFKTEKPVVNKIGQEIPPGSYTNLHRATMETLHTYGELVMNDAPLELNKHLEFMLRARGVVLITGLGLGCVLRGVLANPNVRSVTVIENSPDVIKLVWPHIHHGGKCMLVVADAVKRVKDIKKGWFDCAWHDLWQPPEKEKEHHLQTLHMEMICDLAGKVSMQGAWEFPRIFRKRMPFAGVI